MRKILSVNTGLSIHTHTCAYAPTHVCPHICKHTYVHIYIYLHIHTHMHSYHTHIHVRTFFQDTVYMYLKWKKGLFWMSPSKLNNILFRYVYFGKLQIKIKDQWVDFCLIYSFEYCRFRQMIRQWSQVHSFCKPVVLSSIHSTEKKKITTTTKLKVP